MIKTIWLWLRSLLRALDARLDHVSPTREEVEEMERKGQIW